MTVGILIYPRCGPKWIMDQLKKNEIQHNLTLTRWTTTTLNTNWILPKWKMYPPIHFSFWQNSHCVWHAAISNLNMLFPRKANPMPFTIRFPIPGKRIPWSLASIKIPWGHWHASYVCVTFSQNFIGHMACAQTTPSKRGDLTRGWISNFTDGLF